MSLSILTVTLTVLQAYELWHKVFLILMEFSGLSCFKILAVPPPPPPYKTKRDEEKKNKKRENKLTGQFKWLAVITKPAKKESEVHMYVNLTSYIISLLIFTS